MNLGIFQKARLAKTEIITIRNFSKSFGRKKVIEDLSFSVNKGEIFAFLGANGSGKTTTIRCLLGIYKQNEGDLFVNGVKYGHDQAHILGYLPEERGLYTAAKVLETMIYFGELKGMTAEAAQKAAEEFLARVGLADKKNEEIKKLSSGQQQKIQLGITVINQPELLILDEPTKGLDPVNRSLLMDILLDLNKKGATILFSTHQMEEAEKIADRLLMLKDGKAALYGAVNEVKEQFGSNTIHLMFGGNLPENKKLYKAKVEHNAAEITPNQGISAEEILQFLLSKQVKVLKFEVAAPSLQEIFVKVATQE